VRRPIVSERDLPNLRVFPCQALARAYRTGDDILKNPVVQDRNPRFWFVAESLDKLFVGIGRVEGYELDAFVV
jgi:hypothetical protein